MTETRSEQSADDGAGTCVIFQDGPCLRADCVRWRGEGHPEGACGMLGALTAIEALNREIARRYPVPA